MIYILNHMNPLLMQHLDNLLTFIGVLWYNRHVLASHIQVGNVDREKRKMSRKVWSSGLLALAVGATCLPAAADGVVPQCELTQDPCVGAVIQASKAIVKGLKGFFDKHPQCINVAYGKPAPDCSALYTQVVRQFDILSRSTLPATTISCASEPAKGRYVLMQIEAYLKAIEQGQYPQFQVVIQSPDPAVLNLRPVVPLTPNQPNKENDAMMRGVAAAYGIPSP